MYMVTFMYVHYYIYIYRRVWRFGHIIYNHTTRQTENRIGVVENRQSCLLHLNRILTLHEGSNTMYTADAIICLLTRNELVIFSLVTKSRIFSENPTPRVILINVEFALFKCMVWKYAQSNIQFLRDALFTIISTINSQNYVY